MNLSDLCRFQTEEIRLKTGKIREDLQQEGAGMGSDAVQHALLVYAFEGAFAERGILWKGTQEVYNRSPYCLKEELWEQAQQHLWISRPQTAGGRRLLVYRRCAVPEHFQDGTAADDAAAGCCSDCRRSI